MDESRSTTPPVPPPNAPETLQPTSFSSFESTSAQMDAHEDSYEHNDVDVWPETKTDANRQSKLPRPANSKTPEPPRVVQVSHRQTNKNGDNAPGSAISTRNGAECEQSRTPSISGGSLSSFDWDELEARFEKAIADANQDEGALMEEFAALVKYFNIWAATASTHDNERAAKRLQTRTQFVKLREADFTAKKQSYEQVVAAFQSAMLLLSQAQH